MLLICTLAIFAAFSAAKNDFIPGIKVSISNEKFREARDVYFNFILDNVVAQDMSYLDFGDNKGYAKENQWMIYARADQAEFQLL